MAFGGIAGLFLGFSVLTVAETFYFFTLRACCMAIREKDKLRELQKQYNDSKQEEMTDLVSNFRQQQHHVAEDNVEKLLIYRPYLP